MTYHTVLNLSCKSFSVLTALAIPEYSYPETFFHRQPLLQRGASSVCSSSLIFTSLLQHPAIH